MDVNAKQKKPIAKLLQAAGHDLDTASSTNTSTSSDISTSAGTAPDQR